MTAEATVGSSWPIKASLALLLALCSLPSAKAGGATCSQLEAQLAASTLAGTGGTGRWADAARRQRAALATAQSQAKSRRCRSPGQSEACGVLLPTIDKMKTHLKGLEAKAGGSGDGGQRRIQSALRRNGCGAEAAAPKPAAARTTLVERLFGGSRAAAPSDKVRPILASVEAPGGVARQPRKSVRSQQRPAAGKRRQQASTRKDRPGRSSSQTFRTLCVRPCDGYFFPISFSTTTGRFPDDQKACEAQCPNMGAELYVHPMPQEDVEAMVSVAGTPYRDLKTAFLYKLQGVSNTKTCGCTFAAASPAASPEAAEPSESLSEAVRPSGLVAMPTPRPALDTAVEAEVLMAATAEPAAATDAAVKRPIRVVGPNFFPDP